MRGPVTPDVRPLRGVVEMRAIIVFCVAMGIQALAILAQTATYQEKVSRIERGEYASQIDENTQTRIEADLSQRDPKWGITTLAHSSTASHRLLELRQGELRVWVSMQYLLTVEDAAKHLQYRLSTISMPRFKPLKGVGEEGYVLTEKGHIWLRVGRTVVSVTSSDGVEAERAVAERIVASARAV
jgi:hypothetical protein